MPTPLPAEAGMSAADRRQVQAALRRLEMKPLPDRGRDQWANPLFAPPGGPELGPAPCPRRSAAAPISLRSLNSLGPLLRPRDQSVRRLQLRP
jgi:hypothetical protein